MSTDKSAESFQVAARGLQRFRSGLRVEQFTESVILAWFDAHAPWSPNTKRTYRNRLHTIFDWATTEPAGELVLKNPMVRIKLETRRTWKARNVRQGIWLRRDRVRQVIDGCDDTVLGLRTRVILVLGFYLGLRVSELAGTSWGHFDWDSFELQVWRLQGRNRRGHVLAPGGKGDKPAVLGVADEVHETMKLWRIATEHGLGRPVRADDPVIPTVQSIGLNPVRGPGGRIISSGQIMAVKWGVRSADAGIRNAVKAAGRRAGLQRVLNPHDMRRSYAQMLRDAGFDLEDIRRMLRHTSIATTQLYLEQSNAEVVDNGRRFTI